MAQAEQVFTSIGTVLADFGAELRHVVRLVTYLTRQEDIAALRDVLKSTFGNEAPANSAVLVGGLTEPSSFLESKELNHQRPQRHGAADEMQCVKA
ncbi:Rid family hydrolase [Halomonas sp. I1]|uniref:RidA family protein n=1 Tax=Halomonas sp. I1 TaxID=393536 RepID=UPI0028E02E2E|nr:Rid family hydrolase [Halomonas sp. I1]MDT8894311.1 Rid family hydrolase [Halomonas sp. I1]